MYNYGILSTATIVPRFVQGINESKQGQVKAIASRELTKAKALAKQLSIERYYGSYEELYQDRDIDIIYIPTVNGFHYRDCKKALLHHKHVLVEKPFTVTLNQAQELFDLAKANNCFLMEMQKAVFLPATNKIKTIIEQDIIGKIKFISLQASFPGSYDIDHWMYNHQLGGGCLYGSATYTIEYMQYLFNSLNLKINGSCLKAPTNVDQLCNFSLTINDEILASSTIAMNVNLDNCAIFYGEKGRIVVDNYWKARKITVHINDQSPEEFNYPCQSEFVYEINHVHDCLNSHLLTSPVMTKAMTLQTVSLVEKLQLQWQNH